MEDEIDALFKLPLAEFTPARNALVARLKKEGEQAQANVVRGFTKPSVPAWVVNQLYWQHRKAFDRLIDASDRVRKLQSKQKAHNSPEMREQLEARRAAQADLVEVAGEILRGAEHGDTRPMLRRVTTTLEALATYGSQVDAPHPGRLTAELEPPGFDLLAGLIPASGGTPRAVVRERTSKPSRGTDSVEDERQRAEAAAKAAAKSAVREAERELRAARTQAERTAAALDTAAKRERETEAKRAKAEKDLARLTTEADAARERAREAAAEADKAARAADNAERVLEEARNK